MLNKLIILLAILGVFVFLYFFVLAKKSHTAGAVSGLIETTAGDTSSTRLQPCSVKPNCVCSEVGSDSKHSIEAYSYKNYTELEIDNLKLSKIVWQSLIMSLRNSGAVFHEKDSTYLAVTFSTTFFGFIDDFEARLDVDNMLIHFRSASRVGTSDFGANKKRVGKIVQQLELHLQSVLSNLKLN